MKHYDAIVIGAGVGGLASALLLAHSGKRVALFEKRLQPGGRIGSSQRDGFTVDFGVHLISRGPKGPLIGVLDRCEVDHGIEFTKVRPIQSTGGEKFKFPQDLKGRVPDADFEAVIKMVTDVKGMSDEDTSAYDGQTLEEFLNAYTTDPFVHACVSQIGFIYCCIPEYLLSAGEFARCLKWEAEAHASGYPSGGCVAILGAYLRGLEQYGAEVRFGAPVERIVVEDGRAVGVVVGGEEHRADMIVSNAGLKETVDGLVGPEHFDESYVADVRSLEISFVSIIARFALDTVISPEIKMLSGFSSTPVREYNDRLMAGEVPEELNSFIVVPSSFDPSVAPEGKQLVMMTTAVPAGIKEEHCPAILEALIDLAEQSFPGLREHALFVEKVFPSDAARIMGEDGAGIGIAQQAGQAGVDRPNTKTPLAGLFVVGAEAGGSGVGTELAANSAIEFFDTYVA
ncbi:MULTISPECIES: NAD(P)/FAD-dependent oxidoreductase [unclassified Adlercreutzia]|uniref:phytoene desaturase family protein n=1 Tax=unclassified Adlercreutzia TaxID=2636013 RepID=UPI0013EA1C0A|nr:MULTISPECIES: NAD(P)/FAD-dependent oxidoreductase [unclassified Adlercreutzia]